MTNDEMNRYSRHIILPEFGTEGQQKLKSGKVLVIGAGGLGCPVLQYLTGAGVGLIGIVDDDKVEESNLQRQVIYSTRDVGRYKTEAAVESLSNQNPYCEFIEHKVRLTGENALEIISGYDIVVDGSDNFPTRYLVNDACVILDKPLIFGSVFKFEGQVTVFNYKGGPTYRCLYPEPPAASEVPNCSGIGVLGVLPGMTGMFQANEVIKILIGTGEVLSGKLLKFDALVMSFETYSFGLIPENKKITLLADYVDFCEPRIKEISAEELKLKILQKEKIQLIDVREPGEYAVKNIGGELIPLNTLGESLNKIQKDIPVVIHCQSGIRSKKAVEVLLENGYDNVASLKGGLAAF